MINIIELMESQMVSLIARIVYLIAKVVKELHLSNINATF